MTTYSFTLRKQIKGAFAAASSEDVYVTRVVQLPMPPVVGLTIMDRDGDVWETISELAWNVQEGQLTAYVSADTTVYDREVSLMNKHYVEQPELTRRQVRDRVVREHVALGWKMSE
jgi:hypothetical protein